MPVQFEDDYVDAQEASALLGVKPATLYAYVSRGLVRSYQQGSRRQRSYRRSELNALRENHAGSGETDRVELPEADTWVGER